MSRKQKLNTKSGTESELAGADDFMSPVLWTRCFLHAQGCSSNCTIICQDNTSAILLEKNGKLSGSKQTQHINIRHHFATDRISEGKLDTEHCPTDDMMGDFFTKPLQGHKFWWFGNLIVGVARKHKVAKVHPYNPITKQWLLSTGVCWNTLH